VKGATLAAATRAGVTTARLPIQEHITERLDHILNVNTVIEVLIAFQDTHDWRLALTKALPQVGGPTQCLVVIYWLALTVMLTSVSAEEANDCRPQGAQAAGAPRRQLSASSSRRCGERVGVG